MLSHVDGEYAKVRIASIDAQIRELREQIKALEKKKSIFKGAASFTDESTDD